MGLEVLHDALLLSKLRVEELRVALELVGETLLRLVDELGFVTDSLQESIIDLSLDIVMMVFSLVISVVVIGLLNLGVQLSFFVIQLHDMVVIHFLLFCVMGLNFLHLLSQLSKFLDLWSKLGLSILHFSFNLSYSLSDLLESLILLVIKKLLLIGYTLNLILDLRIALNTLLSLKILHELSKILCSSFKNLFSP